MTKRKSQIRAGKYIGIHNCECLWTDDQDSNETIYEHTRAYGTDWYLIKPSIKCPRHKRV